MLLYRAGRRARRAVPVGGAARGSGQERSRSFESHVAHTSRRLEQRVYGFSAPTWLLPRWPLPESQSRSSWCSSMRRPCTCAPASSVQQGARSKHQPSSPSSSSVQLQRPAPGRSTQVIEVDVVEPQEPEQDVREGIVDDVGQLHWGLGSGPAVRLVEGRPVAAARAGGGGRRTRSSSSSQRTNGSWL